MKLFECIVDDGKDVFKTNCVAKNKKDLLSVYGGNGEFISIKDITNSAFAVPIGDYEAIESCIEKLRTTLLHGGYEDMERTIICSLLDDFLVNRK